MSNSLFVHRWRVALTCAVAGSVALLSSPAFADSVTVDGDTVKSPANVQYGSTASNGQHACTERGTAVPGSISINYNNSGGGLHFTAGENATVTVTNPRTDITVTAPATATIPASWSSGASVPLSLSTTVATTVPVGTHAITITVQGSSSGLVRSDSYNVEVNSACPVIATNSAPEIVVTGVEDGASYPKGSVPAAVCEVSDAEDGDSSFAAELSAITGPDAVDGLGDQTATCAHTDSDGAAASASATYSILDPSAPTISYTLSPSTPNGSNDWYTSDVTLTWLVAEPQSPSSVVKTGCIDRSITADQTSVTYTCSAASAGGTADAVSVTIKRDATKPGIVHVLNPAGPNANGWYNADVTVSFTCSDGTSGVAICSADTTVSTEGADQSVTGTAVDNAGNTQTNVVSGINIDKSAPTIGHSLNPSSPNANGWYNTDVVVSFACDDALSGVVTCLVDGGVVNTTTLGEGADQSVSGTATDAAGNTATDAATGINIDKTAPSVSLVGGPADGSTSYFGFVPGAPTCDASDALSGLDGTCSVSGYATTVGTHTVTATATDNAGNTSTASATYTVSAWTTRGFFQPVDMGGVLNTVKAGSTVPLKFELFAGSTELTSTGYITGFTAAKVNCTSGAEDAIETFTTTGGTSLRYDTTGGQFIQNWKTPTTKGCYNATMTAADGSTITAKFSLK